MATYATVSVSNNEVPSYWFLLRVCKVYLHVYLSHTPFSRVGDDESLTLNSPHPASDTSNGGAVMAVTGQDEITEGRGVAKA